MEHTSNYELSKWAESDRILMEDFNMDHDKIDAALTLLDAKYIFGTYIGNEEVNRGIQFPFQPKLVILQGHTYFSSTLKAQMVFATQSAAYYVGSSGCANGDEYYNLDGDTLYLLGEKWSNGLDQSVNYIAFS